MLRTTLLIAALALAAGVACEGGDEDPPASPKPAERVQAEQAEAANALERAREAQEEAREQQSDVLDAEDDIRERQKELAEAHGQVERERHEATRAQLEAKQRAAEANVEALDAHQKSLTIPADATRQARPATGIAPQPTADDDSWWTREIREGEDAAVTEPAIPADRTPMGSPTPELPRPHAPDLVQPTDPAQPPGRAQPTSPPPPADPAQPTDPR